MWILHIQLIFVDAFGNVETDAGLAKYLAITNNTGTWMPNTYITMPTLAYKTGLAPTTIEAYNQMITDLTGSKVRFKFTATAGPASEVELDGIHYTLNEDKTSYTADGYTNELGNVVIPSTVKGLPVTSIGEDAFDGSGMTSIVVPSSVTSIGGYAFMGCPLASMSLPASITSIGETILDSDALTSFDFPGNSVYKTSPDKTLILSADGASIIAAVHGASTYSIPDSVTHNRRLVFRQFTDAIFYCNSGFGHKHRRRGFCQLPSAFVGVDPSFNRKHRKQCFSRMCGFIVL
jgi:hypothetical protein